MFVYILRASHMFQDAQQKVVALSADMHVCHDPTPHTGPCLSQTGNQSCTISNVIVSWTAQIMSNTKDQCGTLWLMLQSTAAAPLLCLFSSWPPKQTFSFSLPFKKKAIAAMNGQD